MSDRGGWEKIIIPWIARVNTQQAARQPWSVAWVVPIDEKAHVKSHDNLTPLPFEQGLIVAAFQAYPVTI